MLAPLVLSFHHPPFPLHFPGLPKPAIVTHERLLQMCKMLSLCGGTADDVVYTVLPLYHVTGLILGVLSCLELGKPFSEDPSNSWDLQTQPQGGAFRVTRPHK